jgi:hypothetical protein
MNWWVWVESDFWFLYGEHSNRYRYRNRNRNRNRLMTLVRVGRHGGPLNPKP